MVCECNKSISQVNNIQNKSVDELLSIHNQEYSIKKASLDLNENATVCKYTIDNSVPNIPYIKIVGYNTSYTEDCATLISNEPVGSVKYIQQTSWDTSVLSIMKTIAKWIDDNLGSTGHIVTYQSSTYNQYGIIGSCTTPICSFNIV